MWKKCLMKGEENLYLLLLLLLSLFSRVRLCATPQTAAHQAPPSLGFSRQEHWSGLPFPSPMHESENWKWSRSVVSDPVDFSLPGSSSHGIFQARVLEWGATAFSKTYTYYLANLIRLWLPLFCILELTPAMWNQSDYVAATKGLLSQVCLRHG